MPAWIEHNLIFIHIPKTAGTSMQTAFNSVAEGKVFAETGKVQKKDLGAYQIDAKYLGRLWVHLPATELQKVFPKEEWESSFKFSFVRNPWDRLVSLFYYSRHGQDPEFLQMGGTADFNEWILQAKWRELSMAQPQHSFIADDKGKLLVDFVGKFETLEKDFEKVCEKSDLHPILLHHFKSRHRPYTEIYNDETRALVGEHYQKDLELFDYAFGNF